MDIKPKRSKSPRPISIESKLIGQIENHFKKIKFKILLRRNHDESVIYNIDTYEDFVLCFEYAEYASLQQILTNLKILRKLKAGQKFVVEVHSKKENKVVLTLEFFLDQINRFCL